jgi:hypothetical protein
MEFVERADDRPAQISIARCREIALIRRHAETMAWIVVEMFQDHCRIPE